jgi:small-conductance mechanosensitive channel
MKDMIFREIAIGTVHWAPQLGLSIAIFIAFWIGAAIGARFVDTATSHMSSSRRVVVQLLIKVGKISLILFGLATALGTLGVNVSAMVAGLGLTGFALGFALKDMLSNVVSGVMILLYQPFQVGDLIQTSGFEGRVIEIDLRYTIVQMPDRVIFIPNSSLVTNPVVKIYTPR